MPRMAVRVTVWSVVLSQTRVSVIKLKSIGVRDLLPFNRHPNGSFKTPNGTRCPLTLHLYLSLRNIALELFKGGL